MKFLKEEKRTKREDQSINHIKRVLNTTGNVVTKERGLRKRRAAYNNPHSTVVDKYNKALEYLDELEWQYKNGNRSDKYTPDDFTGEQYIDEKLGLRRRKRSRINERQKTPRYAKRLNEDNEITIRDNNEVSTDDLSMKLVDKIMLMADVVSRETGLPKREVALDIVQDLDIIRDRSTLLRMEDTPINNITKELVNAMDVAGGMPDSNMALNFLLNVEEEDLVDMIRASRGRLSFGDPSLRRIEESLNRAILRKSKK